MDGVQSPAKCSRLAINTTRLRQKQLEIFGHSHGFISSAVDAACIHERTSGLAT